MRRLNRDQEIPALLQEQAEIQEQFDRASDLANQLESVLTSFSDERHDLQKEIEEETKWLNQVKDALAKQDNVSGTDEDLIQRLYACKVKKKKELVFFKRTQNFIDEVSN